MRPRTKWKFSKMASCCRKVLFGVLFLLLNFDLVSAATKAELSDDRSSLTGNVHFNNPGLLGKFGSDYDSEEYYFLGIDKTQDAVDPRKWGGLDIKKEAKLFSSALRKLSNDEMGVTKMQEIYDSTPCIRKALHEEKQVDELAQRLSKKLGGFRRVLSSNKRLVENLYKFHVKKPITQTLRCCQRNESQMRFDGWYNCKVSKEHMCDLVPSRVSAISFNPGRNLSEVFKGKAEIYPTLKWQYFISAEGIHAEYPAHNFIHTQTSCVNIHNIRHRNIYVSAVQPKSKNVVILIDHGKSLSRNQLNIAKAIANQVLESLTENDKVGVIGLSSKASYPRGDECLSRKMTAMTIEAKYFFQKFINGLEQGVLDSTAHSLGFQKAFDMIWNTLTTENSTDVGDDAMILYISRGLLSSLIEAKDVLNTIAIANGRTGNKIVINTYGVIDVGKPIMYEKSFLQDIAYQNFKKYGVQYHHSNPIRKGSTMSINSTQDLSLTAGGFYEVLNSTRQNEPQFSLPYSDLVGNGLVVSLSQPCYHDDEMLLGVVGIDVHLSELVEDITYFSQDVAAYSFLIDSKGYALMHPSLTRPATTKVQPMHTDILHFENIEGFKRIRDRMLAEDSGQATLILSVPRNDSAQTLDKTFHATYTWKKVDNSPYTVCIKLLDRNSVYRELDTVNMATMPELVYHRLDLIPAKNTCLHLKQLATLDASSVFLSPSSFKNPFDHLSQQETKGMIQAYLAYLKDPTRLIANPGLKDNVRNNVAAVSRINSVWLRQYHVSAVNDYIVRKFVTTPSGIFRMFPGALLDKSYDPTTRPWYDRALEYPGQIVITPPYLDVAGAGYISTLSHTIYEGRPASMHNEDDRVVAVMGLDITVGYMYKILTDQISVCQDKGIRCFVVDDKGYLISHPDFVSPGGNGPAAEQHITHKEPLVASDILNHEYFVRKQLCNSYNNRTMQRYYQFNTSLTNVLTNLKHGEHCARYLITPVPGTNAFIGIVNQTCSVMTAFCPCSTVDRLCLNCNRMEQAECECPCECPLKMDFCTGGLLDTEDRNPSCPRPSEVSKLAKIAKDQTKDLAQCVNPKCTERESKRHCFGVVDCEWCELDDDGETPLDVPFCTTQRHCFGGVLGASSPYHDEIKGTNEDATAKEDDTLTGAPVGPVAGGIMGCFLMLALGVYCYRHHVHRRAQQYVSSCNESHGQLRRLHNDLEEFESPEEPGHTNTIVLATFENPASISPYRMNTSYRRPTGGDSDHGYSTMTPHEDSEQASTSCMEPMIISKDRYRPCTHYTTQKPFNLPPPPGHSRRSRSPTPPQTRIRSAMHTTIPEHTSLLVPQTTIPECNHILATVQVHMVDTH